MIQQARQYVWQLQQKKWVLLAVILAGVTLFKLTAGLWLILSLEPAPEIGSYDDIANNLLAGHGYVIQPGGDPVFHRPPTYTFFLIGLYFLFGSSPLVVTMAHIFLDLMTCVIIYLLADRLFSRPVALLAALGVGFYPLSLYYDTRQLTEPLFTLLLAGFIYLLVKGDESLASRDFFLAGLLWGVGSLAKTSLMYFAIVAMGVIFLSRLRKKEALLPVISFFVGGILIILPWTIRNYVASGGSFVPVSTAGAYSLWVGSFYPTHGLDDDGLRGEKLALFEETRQEIAGSDRWLIPANQGKFTRAALDNILDSPLRFVELGVRKFFRFWFFIQNPDRQGFMAIVALVQISYLIPGGVGFYYALRERQNAIWPLLLIIGYYVILHALTVAEVRYSVPVMPYVIIFGSHALVKLIDLQWKGRMEFKQVEVEGSRL